MLTVLALSRWQFAITIIFHMLFPAITVGLALFLCIVYGMYWRTGKPLYLQMFRFWRRIFAVAFALGVVAGATITFEMGLNWGPFAAATGPIIGPIIGMEVVSAFFVEAAFIGILLYGDGRVKPRTMFIATCMVAIGTILSVVWILAANSWMQVPVDYTVVNGQYHPTDWLGVIFNPAFIWRMPHMFLGVLVSAAWFIAGLSAYYLIKGRAVKFAKSSFSIGLGIATVLMPLQLLVGDTIGAQILGVYQPAKLFAMEGNWEAEGSPDYNIIVVPDQDGEKNLVQISVPCVGSWIGAHDFTCKAHTPGIKAIPIPKEDRPLMLATFWGFRAMFYASIIMWAMAFGGLVLRLRGTLWKSRNYLKFVMWMAPVGIVAIIGGWVLAEMGRQPWVVYGMLRTSDGVSKLATPEMLFTVLAFVVICVGLVGVFIAYLVRAMKIGPERDAVKPDNEVLHERHRNTTRKKTTKKGGNA